MNGVKEGSHFPYMSFWMYYHWVQRGRGGVCFSGIRDPLVDFVGEP